MTIYFRLALKKIYVIFKPFFYPYCKTWYVRRDVDNSSVKNSLYRSLEHIYTQCFSPVSLVHLSIFDCFEKSMHSSVNWLYLKYLYLKNLLFCWAQYPPFWTLCRPCCGPTCSVTFPASRTLLNDARPSPTNSSVRFFNIYLIVHPSSLKFSVTNMFTYSYNSIITNQ